MDKGNLLLLYQVKHNLQKTNENICGHKVDGHNI